MTLRKLFRLMWVIWLVFIASLFLFSRYLSSQSLFDIYIWTVSAITLLILFAYGAFHPTEIIEEVRLRRLFMFNKLSPQSGDEKLVRVMSLGGVFVAFLLGLFYGFLPLIGKITKR